MHLNQLLKLKRIVPARLKQRMELSVTQELLSVFSNILEIILRNLLVRGGVSLFVLRHAKTHTSVSLLLHLVDQLAVVEILLLLVKRVNLNSC